MALLVVEASGRHLLYDQYMQLSPFYLKRHPEKRTRGDIEDIRRLSKGGLTGVENVFEHNAESFDNLMTQTSESGGEVEAVSALQTLQS